MHHQRVQGEKKKLMESIERLNTLRSEYSTKYKELLEKYDFVMKEKMLVRIERDRLKAELAPKK
jgi:hypothetical protein